MRKKSRQDVRGHQSPIHTSVDCCDFSVPRRAFILCSRTVPRPVSIPCCVQRDGLAGPLWRSRRVPTVVRRRSISLAAVGGGAARRGWLLDRCLSAAALMTMIQPPARQVLRRRRHCPGKVCRCTVPASVSVLRSGRPPRRSLLRRRLLGAIVC